jgi:hypothetical protein
LKLVVYNSGDEIIVCPEKYEKTMVEIYFAKNSGRDLDTYDRDVWEDVVDMRPEIRISGMRNVG